MDTVRRAPRNPFQLMMDPQSVLDAMTKSHPLGRLQRRICHPLDKPAPVKIDDESPRLGRKR